MEELIAGKVRLLLHSKRFSEIDDYLGLLIESGDITEREALAEFWPTFHPVTSEGATMLPELHRKGELKFTAGAEVRR